MRDGDIDSVLGEQVREAVGARSGLISSTVAANLLAAVLLFITMHGRVAAAELYGWFAVQIGFQITRAVVARQYWRQPPDSSDCLRTWSRLLSGLAIMSGTLWGLAGMLFYLPNSGTHQALLAILLCGLAAGSIPANAMLLGGLLGSVTAILGLFIVRLIWEADESHWLMAAMLSVYWVFVLNWGRGLNRVLVDSLNRHYEKQELVEQLGQQKEAALNAQRAAEAANVAKSKFLAAASHDLRQPMHALTLLSGALLEEERPAELKALTRHIARSVDALEMLFNALLDISRLDAGVTKPVARDFALESLFERLRSDFSVMAENKFLRFHIRKTKVVVHSDAQLLEQILRNLLMNAVRYTEAGGIVVGCRKRGDGWRIDVVDTGVGIPLAEQDKVFDEFYQIGNPERDREKGLGLGLAIVRRLSGLMNLPITLRSQPGRGTVFSLRLPAGTGEEETVSRVPEIPGVSFDSLRVLIVDDEADVRTALALLLVGWGCDVMDVRSYGQAMTELESSDWRPQLAIVDLTLSGKENGIALLDWLRSHLDADLPGIIITGDIAAHRLLDVQSSGYTLLHKPASPAKLRALMQHTLAWS
ncbi:MAG: ATP-binding protein [Parasulfuritortus sp.]|nr:ATP-binding protein [Parasulfuritortus sp.]